MSESETVAKNRIEFQWGSKLQGTSSEALDLIVVYSDAMSASMIQAFTMCVPFFVSKFGSYVFHYVSILINIHRLITAYFGSEL